MFYKTYFLQQNLKVLVGFRNCEGILTGVGKDAACTKAVICPKENGSRRRAYKTLSCLCVGRLREKLQLFTDVGLQRT